MKKLLLVRHAKSSWKDPSLTDKERPLNNRGKRDAPFMANYVESQGITVTDIISSPAKRAYKTAVAFHEVFEGSTIQKESDLYFGSESDWMYIINQLDESISIPAFFSHNPTITYFANSFRNGNFDNVPTCGVISLESSSDKWKDLDYLNTRVVNAWFPKLVKA